MPKNRDNAFRKGLKRLALASGAVLMTATLASAQPTISTELNGNRLYFDQPPVMQQGRVLVPLRGIFENLGATVIYNPSTRQIKATGDGNTVELTLGQRQAYINGQPIYLDVPADSIAGRTMVPLRFVSEAMGADVKWLSSTRTVAITREPMGQDTVSSDFDLEENQDEEVAVRPTINQLIHNARGNLRAGDRLTVTMTGDPNGQASFSILGAVENVPMREVSPGRYEGSFTVTQGLDIDNGTLVGYLRRDNLEAVMEADRDVILASDYNYDNSYNNVTSVSPSPNTIINHERPVVTAVFPESIRPGTATISVNGQNYNPSVSYDGRTVSVTPSYALNPGTHTVQAQAMSQDGRLMQRQWNFTVSNTANVNNPYRPSVSIHNLSDGATVPAVFNIIGQTTPYTRVQINAATSRPLIPGIIGLQGREMRTSTVSDSQGRFNVQLNTSNVPSNSEIDLEISVLDSDGTIADTVELDLRRQ